MRCSLRAACGERGTIGTIDKRFEDQQNVIDRDLPAQPEHDTLTGTGTIRGHGMMAVTLLVHRAGLNNVSPWPGKKVIYLIQLLSRPTLPLLRPFQEINQSIILLLLAIGSKRYAIDRSFGITNAVRWSVFSLFSAECARQIHLCSSNTSKRFVKQDTCCPQWEDASSLHPLLDNNGGLACAVVPLSGRRAKRQTYLVICQSLTRTAHTGRFRS